MNALMSFPGYSMLNLKWCRTNCDFCSLEFVHNACFAERFTNCSKFWQISTEEEEVEEEDNQAIKSCNTLKVNNQYELCSKLQNLTKRKNGRVKKSRVKRKLKR